MLPTIGLVLVALVLLVLVLGALRPRTFRVERSAHIEAPPQLLHPMVADFRRWRAWSPWEAVDPEMRRSYSGADLGRGAVYEWDGKKAGAGRMEITEAPSPGRITIQLDFTRPFTAHNTAEFSFAGTNGGTVVSWAMYGGQTYPIRVMSIFFPMDKLVGKDFEKGLASLKALAERSAEPAAL
jgi:hypothetical protein